MVEAAITIPANQNRERNRWELEFMRWRQAPKRPPCRQQLPDDALVRVMAGELFGARGEQLFLLA
ncbi:MAG: hypothetical protein VCA40_12530 [Roseibacillus sp.]|nr:hypothetical protein [Verrucomicrobiota bacterium]